MANSTSNIDAISVSQASKEVTANAFFDAASQAATYGRRASASSGLTWGYYGGNVVKSDGATAQIANGTLTLSASATSYIVAAKATGAVSAATTTTNWDNTTDYWRLYSVVAGSSTVTSYTDYRTMGAFQGGGSGGGGGPLTLTDGATINTDASSSLSGGVFSVTPGAAGRTLANPTNMTVGKTYLWLINTGSGTITSYGSLFSFLPATTPETTEYAGVDILTAVYDGIKLRAVYSNEPAFAGALDPYTPGLWSAAGLKRLLASYTGPLIRVRRSSDDAEQDIGYTSSGHVDEAALLAFAGAGSAYVVRAYDQSGGSNHIEQSTNTNQPRIVSSGVYDGAMVFDGANDMLVTANATPASAGLTFAGRYKLRAAAGPGSVQTIISQENASIASRCVMLFQQQYDNGRYNAYIFDGPSTFLSWEYSNYTASEVSDVLVGNHSLSSASKVAQWRDGASVSAFSSSGPGISATAFTSELVTIGRYIDGSQPANMDGKWFAIWQTAQNANAAAISAAL